MERLNGLKGQTFGTDWTILVDHVTNRRVLARCKCGVEREVRLDSIRDGSNSRCFACRRRGRVFRHITDIIKRCYNPNYKGYKNYGGRGIKVYRPWLSDRDAFAAYLQALPGYGTPGLSIDRINNNKGYHPGNLRYATREVQQRNTRAYYTAIKRGRAKYPPTGVTLS